MPEFQLEVVRSSEGRTLYVQEVFDYQNDGSEGFIEFDGYFYADIGDETEYGVRADDQTLVVWMRGEGYQKEGEPYTTYFKSLGQEIYEVTFTKREIVKNTNQYSVIDDEDGDEMNVCFFPTNRQRIFFTVKKIIDKVGIPVVFVKED